MLEKWSQFVSRDASQHFTLSLVARFRHAFIRLVLIHIVHDEDYKPRAALGIVFTCLYPHAAKRFGCDGNPALHR